MLLKIVLVLFSLDAFFVNAQKIDINKFSDEQANRLLKSFQWFGKRNPNNPDQVLHLDNDKLRSLVKMSEKEIEEILLKYDKNRNGVLEFKEYLKMMTNNEFDILSRALEVLNTIGDGHILLEDFEQFSTDLNYPKNDREITTLINTIKNGNGFISKRKLLEMIDLYDQKDRKKTCFQIIDEYFKGCWKCSN
ncbi:uncharacterized protein LOC126898954 [Daktulosphaira vitifoliae]|uniref:uncharacterized protein LOC126898954 n=1 Tax=Daktulosphaira vitifoliae TaxID=58002 RepID=UPI0021A983DC|nr:uncharacterized protein LOC126898954 [Daktulosphaira vitifoliae]